MLVVREVNGTSTSRLRQVCEEDSVAINSIKYGGLGVWLIFVL